MKKIIFSYFIFCAAFAQAAQMKGRFEKIETGDDTVLILTDKSDNYVSFVCHNDACEKIKENPEEYKNKMLVVSYFEQAKFIPSAGKNLNWKYVDRISVKSSSKK